VDTTAGFLGRPSDHPLSAGAVKRAYGWLSWGLALAIGVFVAAAIHLFVPKQNQPGVLGWIEDWLTNLPAHLIELGKSLSPRTGGFYLLLVFVSALLVRFLIGLTPLNTWLLRYAEWFARDLRFAVSGVEGCWGRAVRGTCPAAMVLQVAGSERCWGTDQLRGRQRRRRCAHSRPSR
jgi:hypothetical protein